MNCHRTLPKLSVITPREVFPKPADLAAWRRKALGVQDVNEIDAEETLSFVFCGLVLISLALRILFQTAVLLEPLNLNVMGMA